MEFLYLWLETETNDWVAWFQYDDKVQVEALEGLLQSVLRI